MINVVYMLLVTGLCIRHLINVMATAYSRSRHLADIPRKRALDKCPRAIEPLPGNSRRRDLFI